MKAYEGSCWMGEDLWGSENMKRGWRMALRMYVGVLVVIGFTASWAHADTEMGGAGSVREGTSVERLCPVSGRPVGSMGPAVEAEYQGRTYRFCCAGCRARFKESPESFVRMARAEDRGREHHHVMGEKDTHVDAEAPDPTPDGRTAVDAAPVREVRLEAYRFGFSPERIVVKKGDRVRLTATSRDVPHGVFIKEYGVNVKVEKGKEEVVTFTADKAGEFPILCSFYCGVGHHRMRATLVVEE